MIVIVITANRGDSANTDHQCSLKGVAYWFGTLKESQYSHIWKPMLAAVDAGDESQAVGHHSACL